MKIKEWFKLFFSGMGIGVASSVPGVSGGTVAVILGVYDKFISAVSNLFKKFAKSFVILLPILLGVILAVIPCIFLMNLAFEYIAFAIICLFAGLIIGSFPSVTDEVKGEKIKKIYIVIAVIAMIIAATIGVLSVVLGNIIDISALFINPEWWFYIVLALAGFLASTALVVPGISGSMVLLAIGMYKPLLERAVYAFKHIGGDGFWIIVLELGVFAVGVIVGFFVISKLMHLLLNKYKIKTFYGIIGFIVGSTISIFFNYSIYEYYKNWSIGGQGIMPMFVEIIVGIVLLAIGVALSYLLIRWNKKKASKEIQDGLGD